MVGGEIMARTKSTSRFFRPTLEVLEERCVLDDASAGYFGINARFLTTPAGTLLNTHLSNIAIGQVEGGRPSKPTLDSASHSDVTPRWVFKVEDSAVANQNTTDHATAVAGV